MQKKIFANPAKFLLTLAQTQVYCAAYQPALRAG
jgi:hypothetical protein